MVKLMILFRKSETPDFQDRYHQSLGLLEKMPGIRRRAASVVHGSPGGVLPFGRILEFYFDDRDAMQAALRSPEGQAAGRDLIEFAQQDAVVLFADVYEE
jgi:uncharacterized protein (TIGR02118 family)